MLSWSIGNDSDAQTEDYNRPVTITADQLMFYESMARIALGQMEHPSLTSRIKYMLIGFAIGAVGATAGAALLDGLIHWLR